MIGLVSGLTEARRELISSLALTRCKGEKNNKKNIFKVRMHEEENLDTDSV